MLEEGVVRAGRSHRRVPAGAARLRPDDPLATLRLGVVLVEARRNDEARPLLERAVKVPSPSYDAWHLLGTLPAGAGRRGGCRCVASARARPRGQDRGSPGRRCVGSTTSWRWRCATAGDGRSGHGSSLKRSACRSRRRRASVISWRGSWPTADAAAAARRAAARHRRLRRPRRERTRRAARRVQTTLARTYLNLGIIQAQAARFARAAELFEHAAASLPTSRSCSTPSASPTSTPQQFAKAVPALARARRAAAARTPTFAGCWRWRP